MFFPLIFFLGIFNISLADTFYVNNSGSPVCNNSAANGSRSMPWCTITYGISKMQSGDTLYVMAGTYNENLYINRPSGTAAKYTVIKAYPGNTVNLTGNGINTGRIKIINSSYINFDGFRITNYNQGIFVESSDNIILQNCEVHYVGQEAIHVLYNSDQVTVQNCIVHDTNQWQYNGEGIYVGTGSGGPLDNTGNVIIRNNIIYNTTDEGIEIKPGTHNCLIEGNLLYNIMTEPLYSGGAGAIEINEATLACPGCPNGLQTWPSNPNHVVRNNIVHSSKTGIRAGTGCIVYNNVVYNIADTYSGILVNNHASDGYTREIYHNTVDVPVDRAVTIISGTADVKNNIGPSTLNNLASNQAYFVSVIKGKEDYHLTAGSAPIDAGVTTDIVTDKDGNTRPQGGGYDIGAYEYISSTGIQNNEFSGLRIKIYPNPAKNILYFENTSSLDLMLNAAILNVLGKKLLDKNIELKKKCSLDISGLSSGVYFVWLSNKLINQSTKIIITH